MSPCRATSRRCSAGSAGTAEIGMVSPQFPRQRISPSAGRDGDHELYTAHEKGLILMGRQYIRFDEIEDVISSVELLALVSPLLRKQPSYWKWAIISVHNGMQGAMVCVLGSTSGVGVLSKKSAKAVFAWHEAGGAGSVPRGVDGQLHNAIGALPYRAAGRRA